MLPELGHLALIIALIISACLGLLPFFEKFIDASALANHFTSRLAKRWTFGLFFLTAIAYLTLTQAFLTDDFSVLYVASNSSISLPWWYKLCAVWGAHEGSILLWVSVLSTWMVAVALFNKNLPPIITTRVLAILSWIAFGFLLFILTTSDPFQRLLSEIPTNGRDLNPLLQDIGFLFHPPVLYMGYVGFSVPFALALAALWSGRLDAKWAAWSRPWTLIAWCFLTMGITLGSWWAYRELGWGGWWFWDPVENASFMPWLVGTALLHSLLVTQKRNAFKAWTALLAIVAFSLSLLGTFLVRSGVLTSVHAFAVDPSRGLFMLIFLLVVMLIALTLYIWRASSLHTNHLRSGEGFSLLSRETFLMLNNVMLACIMFTILLGTLYPLLIEALNMGKLSVGAPYFNKVFSALMIPLLFLMGLGPLSFWQSMPLSALTERTRYAFLFSLTLGLLLPWLLFKTFHAGAALGIFLSLWIIISSTITQYRKPHWGMFFAHVGVAISLAGIVVSSSYSIERTLLMSPGSHAKIGGYTIVFEKIKPLNGPNYEGIRGVFTVESKGKEIAQIKPEKRYYPIQQTVMTDAAIDAGIFRDIYIALGEKVKSSTWIVRVYYKPLIRWIWAGGFLILLGGICAAVQQLNLKRMLKKIL